jgi:hypothetical protein
VLHCGRQALVPADCAAQAAQAAGALVMQFNHLGHPGPVAEARSACSRVRASGSGSQRTGHYRRGCCASRRQARGRRALL